jgi:hypothetical protein
MTQGVGRAARRWSKIEKWVWALIRAIDIPRILRSGKAVSGGAVVESRSAAILFNRNPRDRMDLHPLSVKSILHVDPNDPNVRAYRRNADLVLIVAACRLGISLSHRKFADDLEYQVPSLVAIISDIQQVLVRGPELSPSRWQLRITASKGMSTATSSAAALSTTANPIPIFM